MRTLIIGSGNMGRGIAMRLVTGNNDVALYDINARAAQSLASDLAGMIGRRGNAVVAANLQDAVKAADVVILASWYQANVDLAKQLGDALAGKVVVDISNPLNETYDGLVTPANTSAAEVIRAMLPATTKVVKAFNTTFAPTLQEGGVAGQTLDVFVASDDAAAKAHVIALVSSAGMNAIDAGALERARQLEALALLGITLQGPLGSGFRSGWKLVLPKAA